MTDDTPPVLYISADTSDLTTRYKATPRMHMGADAWVPKETLDALARALPDQIEVYRLIKRSKARKHGAIAKVVADHIAAIMSALAALPAPDEGEQDAGEE